MMKEKYFDLVGMYSAALCLIHCLITPLLFTLPLGISHSPIIDFIFLIVGFIPVLKILIGKSPFTLKVLIFVSFVLIAVAILLESIYHWENSLIYIGAIGLITSHFIHYNSHKNMHS